MKRYWLIIIIILGFCLMVQKSWAETFYVTDSFRISFRSGPGIENRILKFLHSGAQVEVLETGEEWTRVRLLDPEGGELTGWVLSRYLMNREPWAYKFLPIWVASILFWISCIIPMIFTVTSKVI